MNKRLDTLVNTPITSSVLEAKRSYVSHDQYDVTVHPDYLDRLETLIKEVEEIYEKSYTDEDVERIARKDNIIHRKLPLIFSIAVLTAYLVFVGRFG